MTTYRLLRPEDYTTLYESLRADVFHTNTNPMFFVEPETVTTVYEDDLGIVLFLRGKVEDADNLIIRLDIQFVSNTDGKRNLKVMLDGFPELLLKARANGFKEIRFESNVPLMRKFCVKRLGFEPDIDNWLRIIL